MNTSASILKKTDEYIAGLDANSPENVLLGKEIVKQVEEYTIQLLQEQTKRVMKPNSCECMSVAGCLRCVTPTKCIREDEWIKTRLQVGSGMVCFTPCVHYGNVKARCANCQHLPILHKA